MANGFFAPAPAGLTGSAQREPEEEKKRGVFSKFGDVFAGPSDPGLSDEQNAAARKDALINAGLMIALSGGQRGFNRPTLLAALAEGAMFGRETGAASRQGEMLGQLAGQDPDVALSQLRQMFTQALATGDSDGARSIATVIQSMEAANAKGLGMDRPIFRTVGNFIIGIDPNTGEEVSRIETPKAATTGRTTPMMVTAPDGSQVFATFDPDEGKFTEVDTDFTPRTGAGTEQSRKAGFFVQFVPAANEYMNQFEGAPGRVTQALSDRGLGEITSAEQQLLSLHGTILAEAWLRMTTGAAYNPEEIRNARQLFTPRPGDKKPALDEKRKLRDMLLAGLQSAAGKQAYAASLEAHPDSTVPGVGGTGIDALNELEGQ